LLASVWPEAERPLLDAATEGRPSGKADGHLGRNFLAGATGDTINVILGAAGHNLRLLRAWLIRLLAFLLSFLAKPQLAARRNRVPHGRLA
jgi:hypothetical protein